MAGRRFGQSNRRWLVYLLPFTRSFGRKNKNIFATKLYQLINTYEETDQTAADSAAAALQHRQLCYHLLQRWQRQPPRCVYSRGGAAAQDSTKPAVSRPPVHFACSESRFGNRPRDARLRQAAAYRGPDGERVVLYRGEQVVANTFGRPHRLARTFGMSLSCCRAQLHGLCESALTAHKASFTHYNHSLTFYIYL